MVAVGVTVCEPAVAFRPSHPPLAVQPVALVEDQESVDELPEETDVGEAERVRVGAVGNGAVYFTKKFSALQPSGPSA